MVVDTAEPPPPRAYSLSEPFKPTNGEPTKKEGALRNGPECSDDDADSDFDISDGRDVTVLGLSKGEHIRVNAVGDFSDERLMLRAKNKGKRVVDDNDDVDNAIGHVGNGNYNVYGDTSSSADDDDSDDGSDVDDDKEEDEEGEEDDDEDKGAPPITNVSLSSAHMRGVIPPIPPHARMTFNSSGGSSGGGGGGGGSTRRSASSSSSVLPPVSRGSSNGGQRQNARNERNGQSSHNYFADSDQQNDKDVKPAYTYDNDVFDRESLGDEDEENRYYSIDGDDDYNAGSGGTDVVNDDDGGGGGDGDGYIHSEDDRKFYEGLESFLARPAPSLHDIAKRTSKRAQRSGSHAIAIATAPPHTHGHSTTSRTLTGQSQSAPTSKRKNSKEDIGRGGQDVAARVPVSGRTFSDYQNPSSDSHQQQYTQQHQAQQQEPVKRKNALNTGHGSHTRNDVSAEGLHHDYLHGPDEYTTGYRGGPGVSMVFNTQQLQGRGGYTRGYRIEHQERGQDLLAEAMAYCDNIMGKGTSGGVSRGSGGASRDSSSGGGGGGGLTQGDSKEPAYRYKVNNAVGGGINVVRAIAGNSGRRRPRRREAEDSQMFMAAEREEEERLGRRERRNSLPSDVLHNHGSDWNGGKFRRSLSASEDVMTSADVNGGQRRRKDAGTGVMDISGERDNEGGKVAGVVRRKGSDGSHASQRSDHIRAGGGKAAAGGKKTAAAASGGGGGGGGRDKMPRGGGEKSGKTKARQSSSKQARQQEDPRNNNDNNEGVVVTVSRHNNDEMEAKRAADLETMAADLARGTAVAALRRELQESQRSMQCSNDVLRVAAKEWAAMQHQGQQQQRQQQPQFQR